MRRWLAGAMGLAAIPALGGVAPAAEPAACVYKSETYSEGAAICVQKGLMLSCSASGDHLAWKVAREIELSDLCRISPPSRSPRTARLSHRPRRTPVVARAPAPNAKCFVFNGKTYCE